MYKEPQALKATAEFMTAFKQPVLDAPIIPSDDRCELRVKLIQEELNELSDAIKAKDIVEVADALGDLQYVLSGAVHEFGLGHRFSRIFDNIHNSNMSKICNSYDQAADTLKYYKNQGIEVESENLAGDTYIIKRKEDGKVLKNMYYTPATLSSVVEGKVEDGKPAPPFIQRLYLELQDVEERITDLQLYISKDMPNADELQRILLPLQLQSMITYRNILNVRIKSL